MSLNESRVQRPCTKHLFPSFLFYTRLLGMPILFSRFTFYFYLFRGRWCQKRGFEAVFTWDKVGGSSQFCPLFKGELRYRFFYLFFFGGAAYERFAQY